MGNQILIVDDEPLIRRTLVRKLNREGHQTGEAHNGREAEERFSEQSWDIVLLDIKLPDADGLSLLKSFHAQRPDLPVVMMTGNRNVDTVVSAMRQGAYHYITKPFNLDEVLLIIQKALALNSLQREVKTLRAAVHTVDGFEAMIGPSEAMKHLRQMARTVATSAAETLLILGESGTGKNLLAQAIHDHGSRANQPFMEVICTALPENLLESELFGHERGAFTDAHTQKRGLCELADKGTLFLDEIGDMPLGIQAKLLGFLESRKIRRIGGTEPMSLDVRVIAATHQDLDSRVAQKDFREDLYYRLNVIELRIPPLRERPEDILPLAAHFINLFNVKFDKQVKGFQTDAEEVLNAYPWPGNVRELRNAIERGMILNQKDVIGLNDLPIKIWKTPPRDSEATTGFTLPPQGLVLADLERNLMLQALDLAGGNQTRAAQLLGLSRDQLRYRLKQQPRKGLS